MRSLIERIESIFEDYSAMVDDPRHMPKVLAKAFVEYLKPLGKAKVVKAEATAPRGWDYGFLGVFEITYDGEPVKLTLSMPIARNETGGNVAADGGYGVIATSNKAADVDKALRYMASEVVTRFKKR